MFLIIFLNICCATAQSSNKTEVSFVYITNEQNFDLIFNNLKTENSDINLKLNSIKVPKSLESVKRSLICASNPSVIFDSTSNEINHLNSKSIDIPYIKAPSFFKSYFRSVRRFIAETGIYDVTVFIDPKNENFQDIFDGIYVSPLRVIVKKISAKIYYDIRVSAKPNFIVIVASTNLMNEIFMEVRFPDYLLSLFFCLLFFHRIHIDLAKDIGKIFLSVLQIFL